jgi:hypothetical protein
VARNLHYVGRTLATMPYPPAAFIALVIASLVSGTAATQDVNKAAPTVKDVMATMTVPASDAVFSAASEPPKDAAQWVALRASVATLAESGRLLTRTARAKADREWIEMASAMVTEAEATFKAVDAKDTDALSLAADSVLSTCKPCHDRYMDK